MTRDQREIHRKLRIFRYAEEIDHVAKTCRYLGLAGPVSIAGDKPTQSAAKQV